MIYPEGGGKGGGAQGVENYLLPFCYRASAKSSLLWPIDAENLFCCQYDISAGTNAIILDLSLCI